MPKQVLDAIPPRPPGYGRHRELFPRTTGDGFDPLSPATVASDVTIGFVLQLDRAARMVAQHAVDPALPGLEEVIDRLTKATFDAPAAAPYEAEVRRAEERVLVDRVMWLATGIAERAGARHRFVEADEAARAPESRKPRPAKPNRRSISCWPPISSAFWIVPPKPSGRCRLPSRPPERPSATPRSTGWLVRPCGDQILPQMHADKPTCSAP